MSLDYEIYKEGGILNDRYQKIEDISEGSYGYVSLAKDTKEKKLVAVKYIFKLDSDNEDDNNSNNNNNNNDDYSYRDQNHIDKKQKENNIADDMYNKSYDSSIEKKQNLQMHKKSLISSNIKSRLTNDICLEAMYEVDIQTKIGKHENIVQLLDFFDSYIIMEYCSGGDMYEAIKDDIVPRSTKAITNILNQILDAVEFVHNKHIYHRDIKPENILITGMDWTIKLTDWGLATTDATSMDRSVGSERYMAPELFESNLDIEERKEPYDCAKVDLWAMGIVFLNIVFEKNPFSVANQSDKSFCYFAANREALFDVFSSMAYDFFQVLRYCLTIDPANRDLKQMRYELDNLSEYTFDDEYYNSLEEGYDTEVSEAMTITPSMENVPPSSAPVSLPTPLSSSKPPPKLVNNNGSINSKSPKDKTLINGIGDNQSQTSGKSTKKQLEMPKFNAIQDKLYNHYKHPNQGSTKNVKDHLTVNNNDSHQYTNTTTSNHFNNDDPLGHERAKSAPKSKYHKKHHGNKPRHNKRGNGRHNNQNKGIKIANRNKSKIIKHSRKPLGIPTPNTHINNFFHDYKKQKEQNFNTRDFFTPPSVQNRYMEGIFDHKYNNKHNKYNNYSSNHNSWNKYNNSYMNSYNNNNGYYNSYSNNNNNNNNNNNKYNKYRRPSTTGNSGYNNYSKSYGQRNSFNNNNLSSGFLRRGSTTTYNPGSYIPPNARNSFSASYNIPDISTVLDSSNKTSPIHHELTAHELSIDDDGHDSDDNLFKLDEGDHHLMKSFNDMSLEDKYDPLHSNNQPNKAHLTASPLHYTNHDNNNNNNNSNNNDNNNGIGIKANERTNNDLPDLLKSPVPQEAHLTIPSQNAYLKLLNNEHYGGNNSGSTVHTHNQNIYNETVNKNRQNRFSFDQGKMNNNKPGVYVPPHHRRASINESTLSVSHNSVKFGGSFQSNYLNGSNNSYNNSSTTHPYQNARRRSSVRATTPVHLTAPTYNNKPIMPINNPGTTTISLQDEDVFANHNNEALFFEDDEDDYMKNSKSNNEDKSNRGDGEEDYYEGEIHGNDGDQQRTIFGPYQIYDNESDHDKIDKFRGGRKSSSYQDEIVGSLDQYKNNWLMLQQQQD